MKFIATYSHIDWGQSNWPDKRLTIETGSDEAALAIAKGREDDPSYFLLSVREQKTNRYVYMYR